jgi:hypothetical protein
MVEPLQDTEYLLPWQGDKWNYPPDQTFSMIFNQK